jgi:hypothetical protein
MSDPLLQIFTCCLLFLTLFFLSCYLHLYVYFFCLLLCVGKDGLETGEDGGAGGEQSALNPFPEAEIDDMRAVRDAALTRYVQVGWH